MDVNILDLWRSKYNQVSHHIQLYWTFFITFSKAEYLTQTMPSKKTIQESVSRQVSFMAWLMQPGTSNIQESILKIYIRTFRFGVFFRSFHCYTAESFDMLKILHRVSGTYLSLTNNRFHDTFAQKNSGSWCFIQGTFKKYFIAVAYGICRISGNSPSTDDLDVTEKFNGCGKALFVVTNECAKM